MGLFNAPPDTMETKPMRARDAQGRFLPAGEVATDAPADTGNPTDAGSDIGKNAGVESGTGKAAVGIQHTIRRRIGNRMVVRPVTTAG